MNFTGGSFGLDRAYPEIWPLRAIADDRTEVEDAASAALDLGRGGVG